MLELVEVAPGPTLDDYAAQVHLAPLVADLRQRARSLTPRLSGRTLWMVNSTAEGGGVAEMLPRLVAILRELGVQTRWAVIGSDEHRFFDLTKHLHNLIHGEGPSRLDAEDRAVYEAVSLANAEMLGERLRPGDIVVAHDPQPLGAVAMVARTRGVSTIWRCHIGLDHENAATAAAWGFLRPWLAPYDHAVFSVAAYVPPELRDRARVIPPAIDPLSHKNRELSIHKLTGILAGAALHASPHPQIAAPFDEPALRLLADGSFGPATLPEDLGLLYRPVVTQVSRWDRLKGFLPLLRGFVRLKQRPRRAGADTTERHAKRLEIVRLVLAGPDPRGVRDDPEGAEVLEEICGAWRGLPPALQRDVGVLVLPMTSRKCNALMVNALQRCSTVVVQSSQQEGFGLTATEAMWKACPVLVGRVGGLRAQVRPGVDGAFVDDPTDPAEIATKLDLVLAAEKMRTTWGLNGRRRVSDEFLVFAQVRRWLELLVDVVGQGGASGGA